MYCTPEDNEAITKYNIENTDEYLPYPSTMGTWYEEISQILTTPKIITDSASHQLNKRMVSQDICHHVKRTRNKYHHILLMRNMRPFFALLRSLDLRGCMIYRRILNSSSYRQQVETEIDSNGQIEIPNGHFNAEDSKGGNNWFDSFCSQLERRKEFPCHITRQSMESSIRSGTSINQVCT